MKEKEESIRRLTAFIALSTLIAFACLPLIGCGQQENACIEHVLREDNRASENAESVSEIVTRMRAIDTSRCPADFRTAYLAHIHAWENRQRVEQEAEKLGKPQGFLDGIVKFGKVMALKDANDSASKEIRQTFQEVERVAVLHGAKLPKPKQASE